MDTTITSRHMAHTLESFGPGIRRRLAKVFNDLRIFSSRFIAQGPTRRELKKREAQQTEVGYEARKRKLLIALRQKISERRTK
jgi:hypothetical protein